MQSHDDEAWGYIFPINEDLERAELAQAQAFTNLMMQRPTRAVLPSWMKPTVDAMKAAPPDSFYVCFGHRANAEKLALAVGRQDLEIVSVDYVISCKLQGSERNIVVDPECFSDPETQRRHHFWEVLEMHKMRIARNADAKHEKTKPDLALEQNRAPYCLPAWPWRAK
jgi:hypothetical protein